MGQTAVGSADKCVLFVEERDLEFRLVFGSNILYSSRYEFTGSGNNRFLTDSRTNPYVLVASSSFSRIPRG